MGTAVEFAALPPEIISGAIYSGPGSATMVAAATAWDALATELHSAATAYSSMIAELAESWHGPAAARMAAAVAPFVSWLSATATQARQAGAQATAAVSAFETAFAATVPPPMVAANRSQLATLLATNILGQHTAAIATLEAQYAQMWAQDATMMYGYAASSEAAGALTPFTAPPQTSRPEPAGTAPPSAMYETMFESAASVSKLSTIANFSMGGPNLGMAQFKTFYQPAVATVQVPPSALGAGLRAGPAALPAGLSRAVSATTADANLVGRLSVPPSWAARTPAIQLATQVSPGTSLAAAPASGIPADSIAPMAMGSLTGGALGGAAFRVLDATGGQQLSTVIKPGNAPVKLDRVIAQLQQKPDSVQHWNVDQAGLDDLITELSKKPGVHAVHLAKSRSG